MSADERRARLLERFRAIGQERLEGLNQGLQAVAAGSADAAVTEPLRRELHTLKGEAKMLGVTSLSAVAHHLEELLETDRRGEDPDAAEQIFAGLDLMDALLHAADLTQPSEALVAATASLVGQAAEGPSPADAAAHEAAPGAAAPPAGSGVHRVDPACVNRLTHLSGDLLLSQALVERATRDLHRLLGDWRRAVEAGGAPDAAVAAQTQRAIVGEMGARLGGLAETSFESRMLLEQLQDDIAEMRLLDIGSLLRRFPAAVRQLARAQGKEVDVQLRGTHVSVDKQVIDGIQDALLHLVRNSVDHGLEAPEARLAAGKPRRGTLTLAVRAVGAQIELRVGDDGRGLDDPRIAQMLVARGMLRAEEVASMPVEALRAQIFRSGFSTREQASEVSGRGVGLDVVRQRVEAMGGAITVDSQPGRGAGFVLRLPVSIALLHVLLVRLSAGLYAVPSTAVEQVLHVDARDVERAGDGALVRLADGQPVAIHELAALIGLATDEAPRPGRLDVVVIRSSEGVLGLHAPKILGERQVVQQAPSPFLSGLNLVAGTAVIEGGELAVCLSVDQLHRLAQQRQPTPRAAAPVELPVRRRILVVEDSDLTRDLLLSTLGKLGYETCEAVNGQDALEQIQRWTPDLVVTDLDMPLMDGYELIRRLKADARTAAMPAVVLSTRDTAESKRRAAEAGACAYLVKRVFDPAELAALLESLLAGARSG